MRVYDSIPLAGLLHLRQILVPRVLCVFLREDCVVLQAKFPRLEKCGRGEENDPENPESAHREKLDVLHSRNAKNHSRCTRPPHERRPRSHELLRHGIIRLFPEERDPERSEEEESTESEEHEHRWIFVTRRGRTRIEPVRKERCHAEFMKRRERAPDASKILETP